MVRTGAADVYFQERRLLFRVCCWAFVLLLSAGAGPARADASQRYRDSLTAAYNRYRPAGPADTTGIKILIALSYNCTSDSLERAYVTAQQVAGYSVRAHWPPGLVYAMCSIGNCFVTTESWDDAIKYFRNAALLAHDIGRKDLEVRALCRLSDIYKHKHDTDSMAYYRRETLRRLAYLTNRTTKSYFLNDLAADYTAQKKYDSALLFAAAAFRVISSDKKSSPDEIALGWNDLAWKYRDLRLYDSALYCIRQGMSAANAGADSARLDNLIFSLAFYYRDIGRLPQALFFAHQALRLSPHANSPQFLGWISGLYERSGQYDSALYYHKLYTYYYDRERSNDQKAERSKEIVRAVFTGQISAFKAEQEYKDRKQAAERTVLVIVSVLAVVLVLLAVLFARANQRNKGKNKTISLMAHQLEGKNREIQVSLQEKENLLKEIHHRVKNNLQVVSSLLNLQLSGISDPLVQQALQVSNSRIKAISLIHKQLYQHDSLAKVEFRDVSNKLFSQVATLYRFKGIQPALTNELPPVQLHADTAIIVSLILNELFTNSFKHAFTATPEPVIRLQLEAAGPGLYRLLYSDNGPGLPEGIDPTASGTLGMRLMTSLSAQLGGSFSYDRSHRRYIISFRDTPP